MRGKKLNETKNQHFKLLINKERKYYICMQEQWLGLRFFWWNNLEVGRLNGGNQSCEVVWVLEKVLNL